MNYLTNQYRNAFRNVIALLALSFSFQITSAQNVFEDCELPSYWDGANLIPEYSFDEFGSDFSFGSFFNNPSLSNCMKPVLAYYNETNQVINVGDMLIHDGWSHDESLYFINKFFYFYDQNPDSITIDPAGRMGTLFSPMDSLQSYVLTAMMRGDFYTESPTAGYYFHFNRAMPLNSSSNSFEGYTMRIDDEPYFAGEGWFAFGIDSFETIKFDLNTQASDMPNIVETSGEWEEHFVEFTPDGAWERILIHNGMDAQVGLFQQDGMPQSSSISKPSNIDAIKLVPKNSNPLSISVMNPSTNAQTWRLDVERNCFDSEVVLRYVVEPMYDGPLLQDVTLKLSQFLSNWHLEGHPQDDFDANGEAFISAGSNDGPWIFEAVYNLTDDVNTMSEQINRFGIRHAIGSHVGHMPTVRFQYVEPTPCEIADFNSSGDITVSDLTEFLAVNGLTVPDCSHGDFNGNNLIQSADLTVFLSLLGQTCSGDDALLQSDGELGTKGDKFKKSNFSDSFDSAEIKNTQFLLFPNPATERIQIVQKESENMEPVILNIIDISGNVVLQESFIGQIQIDLIGLSSGLYTVLFNSDGRLYQERFVVNK